MLYAVALVVALLIGFLLPEALGLVLLGAMALGAAWRLGGRVSRVESILEQHLGIQLSEEVHRNTRVYETERAHIRARMARYAEGAKEEKKR